MPCPIFGIVHEECTGTRKVVDRTVHPSHSHVQNFYLINLVLSILESFKFMNKFYDRCYKLVVIHFFKFTYLWFSILCDCNI